MRLKLCFLTGILLFSALFFISVVAHASVSDAIDTSGLSVSSSSASSASDIVPAKKVSFYVPFFWVVDRTDPVSDYSSFLSKINDLMSLNGFSSTSSFESCKSKMSSFVSSFVGGLSPSYVFQSTCSFYFVDSGGFKFYYNMEFYARDPSISYVCPPDDKPEYVLFTSNPNEANSDGKYCMKKPPDDPCLKLKGVNNVLQVTQYFISKTGGSPACENGCEMNRVGTQWEFWKNELGVPMASASYVYSGAQCDSDYNYRETPPISSAYPSVPSSAASSANPTNPSSANPTNPSSANPTNPSSANPTNPSSANPTNPSSANPTNPSSANPTNPSSANPSGGGGGGGGGSNPSSPDKKDDPSVSSSIPFVAPTGSKDYLKDVFSSDAVKSVQSQRDAMLVKINDKMAQIKALSNINNISVSGDLSPDVKSVRGNDVDFSGKDILSKFSISWVFYFITALWCMDIILNRRKK